jgi:hypothetical protein
MNLQEQISRIKSMMNILETIVYRGAESPEFGKGNWNGVWVSPDKKIAGQYVGHDENYIWKYELNPNINLLNTQDNEARMIEEAFIEKYPEQEEFVNQDGEFAELWMFPPNEFVDMLKEMDYDGYINGSDIFVINLNMIEQK